MVEDKIDTTDERIAKLVRARINRRKALSTGAKIGIGVGVVAVVGGGIAAALLAQPAPTPATVVQTVTEREVSTITTSEVTTITRPEVTTITQAGTVTTVTRPVTEVLTKTETAAPMPKYGGTLKIQIPDEAINLNPLLSGHVHTLFVGGAVYDRLIMRDWDLNLLPDLAHSWDISPDGKTYTFNLVRNATWHDGVPFTSEDVVYTFTQVAPEFFPFYESYFFALESVEATDDYTVVFRLSQPYADFLTHISQVQGGTIIPKHLYEGTNILENPHNTKPVGTGPFKFASWEKGFAMTVERNENYFMEGKPYLDKIVWVVIGETGAQIPAFQAGTVDALYFAPPSQAGALLAMPDAVVVSRASPSFPMYKIQFNLRDEILSNKTVRQALYHAANRDGILEKVFLGFGSVPTGPIGNTTFTAKWVNPNVRKYPYDPKLAEQLLDQAGYERGADGKRFKIQVIVPAGALSMLNVCELLRDQWSRVGVEYEILQQEAGLFLHNLFEVYEFDTGMVWYFGGPTPGDALGYLQSSQINNAWFTNSPGFSNSRFDQLFEAQRAEVNVERRKQLLYEMQTLVMEDPPELYICSLSNIYAWKKGWHGLPAPVGNPTEWYGDIWYEGE